MTSPFRQSGSLERSSEQSGGGSSTFSWTKGEFKGGSDGLEKGRQWEL